jgi:chromosome segregation ATPase
MTNYSYNTSDRLRRKSTAIGKVLRDAEASIELSSENVAKLLADYEQHHTFLRSIAHKTVQSNTSIQRNAARLEKNTEKIRTGFEGVIEMIQLAKLKATSIGADMEKILVENEKLEERVEELECGGLKGPRKSAEDRWLVSEREGGPSVG